MFRPENVRTSEPRPADNLLDVTVTKAVYQGSTRELTVCLKDGQELIVDVPGKSPVGLGENLVLAFAQADTWLLAQ
jgi:hypothetical protein